MSTRRVLACLGLSAAAGCSSFTDVPPPSSIVNPNVVQSQDGAITVYNGVLSQFADLFGSKRLGTSSFAFSTGIFTDEYTCMASQACAASGSGGFTTGLDLRRTSIDMSQLYVAMQKDRLSVDQAVGLLKAYAPGAPRAYTGELHAIKGYVYILFGEFFCSGVPFSQKPYGGDISYGKAETTQQMFEDAVAQFDSALTFSADSAQIQQLAMVGKGRALLDLGQFADAAAAVSGVTTDFRYDIQYNTSSGLSNNYLSTTPFDQTVANHEGSNGLNFASSNDLRLALTGPRPAKLAAPDAPLTLADGVEARLIEAEAKLQANDIAGWAGTLNDLRATAGIPALTADSTTTASATLQQNVMFRERAFWMFGTGHRQGDLRRLIRQYGRLASSVYPTGTSTTIAPPLNSYSTSVVVDPPVTEAQGNPNYKGCLSHDA